MFGRCSHGQTTVLYLTRNEEAALGLQAILKQNTIEDGLSCEIVEFVVD